jgi:hypothetical protein
VTQFFAADGKGLFISDHELVDIPSLDTSGVKDDDRDWVWLAATVGDRFGQAILVTTDGPLRDAIADAGWVGEFGITPLSPADCLTDL